MSDTATVPTDEQLKEYATQLPDLYKDILAAYQYADPSRARGEGLFEEQLANFLWNEAMSAGLYPSQVDEAVSAFTDALPSRYRWAVRRYRFSQTVNDYNSEEFSVAVQKLIANGFIEPRAEDENGRLVPTAIGERLIEMIAGKPAPANKVPELPKPAWR